MPIRPPTGKTHAMVDFVLDSACSYSWSHFDWAHQEYLVSCAPGTPIYALDTTINVARARWAAAVSRATAHYLVTRVRQARGDLCRRIVWTGLLPVNGWRTTPRHVLTAASRDLMGVHFKRLALEQGFVVTKLKGV